MDKKIFGYIFGILLLALLLPITVNADCIGATYNLTCGSTVNESCVLNESTNFSGTCFTIDTNDITINCNGYTLLGVANNTIGITFNSIENTLIKNCIFSSNYSNSRDNIFEGIYGTGNEINTTIFNNTFLNNTRAIRFDGFLDSINVSNNLLTNGEVAMILWGIDGTNFTKVIIRNNTATNFNTSYYWNSIVNLRYLKPNIASPYTLEMKYNNFSTLENPPVVELTDCDYFDISYNNLTGNGWHMNLNIIFGSSYNHVYRNTIVSGTDGIFLTGSHNLVELNNVTRQVHHNLILYTHPSVDNDVANNTIKNNSFTYAEVNGMISADMGPGDIYNNTIAYNNFTEYGITGIYFDFSGTTFGTSDNMTINHNFISSDEGGNLHNGFIGISDNNLNFSSNYINFSEQYSFYYTCPYDNRNLIIKNNTFKGSEVLISNTYGALISNNSILNSESWGLDLQGGGDNIISNNYINNTNGDGFMTGIGINLVDTGNNNISNTKIENSLLYDVQGSVGQDNNLINCTFSSLDAIDSARVFVLWYLDGYVRSIKLNPVNGSLFNATDNTGALAFSVLTNSSGYIPRQNITQYYADASGRTYLTNYLFNASKNPYTSNNQTINITGNYIIGGSGPVILIMDLYEDCSSWEKIIYPIIGLIMVLALIVVLLFYWRSIGTIDNSLLLKILLFMFIAAIFGTALIDSIYSTMAARCLI